MSYILEALKKSQRERDLGKVPSLETQQESPTTAGKPARSRLVPILLLNALLLLGVLGYLVLTQPGPGLLERKSEQHAAADDPAPPKNQEQPAAPAPEAAAKPPAATANEVAEATTAADPAPAPATAPPPQPDAAPPKFSDLPAAVRQQISPPTLQVHVYSENHQRRFIVVGGRQYQEGDRLPGNLKLDKITPDGVELSHQDQPFHLPR
ncbi:general secretion pathway protein GspB [Desulfurivibrio alkaliphilus]|uniref:Type II secretion system protein GspB C-terminal domain-containing protein n=1 Tax=Desulfurivibrio alkaliphilus (strain DSM 19089 / UNIQEM U267 / AHT2) TaxID=589865 RepID=D6Z012_DESAT|nr:general secretion pathway protein GspB [Desulfurivibrio alkaliphilus]ADH85169.1 conserved hypothetical protein [Desulfurivibrio alkaliphilus AHT 2]